MALLAIHTHVQADDWPQWRGPDRSNVSRETGLLKQWPPEGPPLLWSATGLGEGITSVAIEKGRLFTLGNHGQQETVLALDASTGELQWSTPIGPATQQSSLMRWLSPRTPTSDGERLYAITSSGQLACLRSSDGAILWQRSYPDDFGAPRPVWGFCDYPLVDDEKLICTPGGTNASFVALNKRTGEVLWKSAVPDAGSSAYAAVTAVDITGRRQYVNYLQKSLIGIDAIDGRFLWRYDNLSRRRVNSYTPVRVADRLFCPSGYSSRIASLGFASRDPAGVVVQEQYYREAALDAFEDCTAAIGDYVYTWQRAEAPMCLNMKTGEITWGSEKGAGQGRAAVTCANGHLYFLRSDGRVLLVEANPVRYIEKGSFQLPGHQMSVGASFPVIAGGRLYLRDDDKLFCYDVKEHELDRPKPEPRQVALNVSFSPKERTAPPASARIDKNRTPDAIYVPTPQDIVEKMLELAHLTTKDTLYDLGSGDGRFLITAAKKYASKAVGYEIDQRLVNNSREAVQKEKLGDLVRVQDQDMFTADLSSADVVVVYLPSPILQRLLPQLDKLKPGSRVISHQFDIPGLKPESVSSLVSTEDGDQHRIFLWTTPFERSAP